MPSGTVARSCAAESDPNRTPARTALLAALGAGVIAMALAGCGEGTSSDAPAQPSATPTPGSVTALKPCDLLHPDEVARYHFTPGKDDPSSDERDCQWIRPSADRGKGEYTTAASIRIQYTYSLGDVVYPGAGVASGHEGRHAAKTIYGGPNLSNTCIIAMALTDTSSIQVAADPYIDSATRADRTTACRLSDQLASLIEPRLPI